MLQSNILLAGVLVTLAISSVQGESEAAIKAGLKPKKSEKKLKKVSKSGDKSVDLAAKSVKDKNAAEQISDNQELLKEAEDNKAMEEAIKNAIEDLAQKKKAAKEAKEAAKSARQEKKKQQKDEKKAKESAKKAEKEAIKSEKKKLKKNQKKPAEKIVTSEDEFLQTDQQHEYQQDLQAEYAQEGRKLDAQDSSSSSSGYYYESPYPQYQRQPLRPYRPQAEWPQPYHPQLQEKSANSSNVIMGGQPIPLAPHLTEASNDPFGNKIIDLQSELASRPQRPSSQRAQGGPWQDVETRRRREAEKDAQWERYLSEQNKIASEIEPHARIWNSIKRRTLY